jgi:hypothetical protein
VYGQRLRVGIPGFSLKPEKVAQGLLDASRFQHRGRAYCGAPEIKADGPIVMPLGTNTQLASDNGGQRDDRGGGRIILRDTHSLGTIRQPTTK